MYAEILTPLYCCSDPVYWRRLVWGVFYRVASTCEWLGV